MKTPLITAIIVLSAAAFPAGLRHMALLEQGNVSGLGVLEFSKVINAPDLLRSHLMIPRFVPAPPDYIAVLERLQLLEHPRRETAVLKATSQRATRETPEFGRTDRLRQRDASTFEMSGWSFLPDYESPAPFVVLAYRAGDDWIGFAISDVRELRWDVVVRFHDRNYLESGWRKTFRRDSLPAEAERISAWAVDPYAAAVYKLPGDYSLTKL